MKPRVYKVGQLWAAYWENPKGEMIAPLFETWRNAIRYALSLTALLLLFALCAAPARGQTVPSSACAEEGSGGSPNNFPITATAGDSILVSSGDYLGSANISSGSWSSGTEILTLDSFSGTPGNVIVYGNGNSAINGVHAMTAHSSTSVSFALATNPGTVSSGGNVQGDVQSITDNSSGGPNTYSELSGTPFSTPNESQTMWLAQNVKGGSYTVSVTYTTGDQFNASCVLVLHGMPASGSIVDVNSITTYASNATITTPSIGGNLTNEIFVATSPVAGTLSSTGVTACGGNTFTAPSGGNGQGGNPFGYFITGATTGTICAGLTQTPANAGIVQIISFKSSSSTSSSSPAPRRFIQFESWLPWPIRWLLGVT